MKRTHRDYLSDIIPALEDIERFTEKMDSNSFKKDKKTAYAVIKALEIIGEAAKQIPMEIRENYPDIPWKYMTGIRDKLIHAYHGIDLDLVWELVRGELPSLKEKLKDIRLE